MKEKTDRAANRAEVGLALAQLIEIGEQLADPESRVESQHTYKLSGGEKRLVALATVLAMEPDVLLLDEPTAGLDTAAVARVSDILADLPQAMAIVAHDRTFLDPLVGRLVRLEEGRLR